MGAHQSDLQYPRFEIQDNFELCLKVAISLSPSWEAFVISLLDGIDKERPNTYDFINECIRENEKHEETCSKDPIYKGNVHSNVTQ